jgi:hypothetical protein
MRKNRNIIFILIILIFASCKKTEDDYIFEKIRFENLDKLNLNQLINSENEIGSKERNSNNTFGIGNDYYPNDFKYELSNPRVFEINQKELGLETNYFYSKKDSLVKVILYQWNKKYLNFEGYEKDTLRELKITEKENYQNKFENLKECLTEKLGKATEIDIEKRKDTSYNYSDNYRWIKQDLNAYLSFKVSGESYREIRLVIHKK